MSKETTSLNERELREKLETAHFSLKQQAHEYALQLGGLMLALAKSSKNEQMELGGKQNAFTAISEELSLRLAIIEFIEQLDMQGVRRARSLREELLRRHAAMVQNLERSSADVSARAVRFIQSCTESRDKGNLVPLGAKARANAAGEHSRMMKDLAILGFIQQFGITTKSTRRADL